MTKIKSELLNAAIAYNADLELDPQYLGEYPMFRTPYTQHIRVVKRFQKPTATKQEFKEECNVNKIVANFLRTGNMELINKSKGQFLDLTQLPVSFHEALNLVSDATQAFMLLPSELREKYGNDVSSFLAAAYENPDEVFSAPPRPADPNNLPAPPQVPPAAPMPSTELKTPLPPSAT